MSNQDDDHLRGTIRFEDIDVDQSSDAVPDDLMSQIEGAGHEVDAVTNPFMPVLPALSMAGSPDPTLRKAVPVDLIEATKVTRELDRLAVTRKTPAKIVEDHGALWCQRFLTVGADGMLNIYMPDAGFCAGDKVEVLIRLSKTED